MKELYPKILQILHQFMDLEVSNNLIWGQSKEYSIQLLKECGYEVTEWSWYDGPIVTAKCTEYPDFSINYAACANTYCIVTEEPLEYLNIQIVEVGKLCSGHTRSQHNFSKISVRQQCTSDFDDSSTELTHFVGSREFECFKLKLFDWQKSFDKTDEYDYTITIYIGKGVKLNTL